MTHYVTRMSAALWAALQYAVPRRPGTRQAVIAGSTREFLESIETTLTAHGHEAVEMALDQSLASVAKRLDHVSLAVTGLGWLGGGIPAVERVLLELLTEARQEIIVTAFSISGRSRKVMATLRQAMAVGVRCTLLINRISEQPSDVQRVLRQMSTDYPGQLNIYDFCDQDEHSLLHAKVVVVDRTAALVGSANLSFHGMVSAHELAVIVRGPTAALIAMSIDRLLGARVVNPFA